MCFGCSKELSHRNGSFEYPQHMFWMRKQKNNFLLRNFIWGPVILSCFCYQLLTFFKINFFRNFFQEHYQSVNTDLIWVQQFEKDISRWQRLQLARKEFKLHLVYFDSLSPINNLSVKQGRVFLGWNTTEQGLMCLAQGHDAVTQVRLKSVALSFDPMKVYNGMKCTK